MSYQGQTVGELYSMNGQTDFPCYTVKSNSIYTNVVRYRWNGSDWMTEIVEEKRKLLGSGK